MLKRHQREHPTVRLYLCGRPTVECGERHVSDGSLGGRQGRLLLTFLGTRRRRPVGRSEVIEAVWGTRSLASVETTLNTIVSKLRTALRRIGLPAPYGVATESGSCQFAIDDAWIDVDAAKTSRDSAEGALRVSDARTAWACANVAAAVCGQPFLADEQAPWIERERASLRRIWRRALIVLSVVSTATGEFELGIEHAADALAAEPLTREPARR